MPSEIDRQRLQAIFGDFIDHKRKGYCGQKYVPSITFWGFYRIFCLGSDPAAILNYSEDHNEHRMAFLKQVFEHTSVDPWDFIFVSGHSAKTEHNLLTDIWHLTWKYKKLPKSFGQMLGAFRTNPQFALDGVARNITGMIERHQIDSDRAGSLAFDLLRCLYSNYLSGPKKPDTERSLSILLMACLLGDDVVFGQQHYETVTEWLDRKRNPSGLLVARCFKNVGIYHIEDAQINTKLLPDIVCEGKRYDYQKGAGSPLRQIISEQRYQWIFLSGQAGEGEDSTISGAGKTTSLRFLALEEKGKNILWLPLAEIYDHHNIRNSQILSNHISTKFHMEISQLPESTFFLLDGLDELISREQLERLSGDLYMLQHTGKFGLIVSSKLPWQQMSRIDVFYQWSDVWEQFLPCYIQNLSKKQIEAMVSEREEEPLPKLNTPFLLSLYLQTASLPDDPWTKNLIRRWRAERLFRTKALTEELIFYRSLVIQIIRWYETAQGQKIRWEMDAFFLFHTIPAIACQMYRSEQNDPGFDPVSAIEVNREFVEKIIAYTWNTVRPWLGLFPGYSVPSVQYERLLRGIDFEKFVSGAIPSLFHGEWNGNDQYSNPRFTNYGLRDNLALIHIANEFLLASEGALEEKAETIEAYGYTVELIPAKQLQKIVAFFELIAGKNVRLILRHGPEQDVKSPVSRFLAGHIGATMCEHIPDFRKDETISSDPWYESMISAFRQLEENGDHAIQQLVEQRFGLAYIFGQTIYARNLRGKGRYAQADQCAEQIIAFQKKHPKLINSDGYHVKALILFEQMRLVLNGKQYGELRPIRMSEIEAAVQLTHELQRLTGAPQAHSDLFPELSEAQSGLIPIFSMMLSRAKCKWDGYAQRQFFGNPVLEYLCFASYVAKYYSILAALSPGNSGAAYNLLGSLMANNSEMLENDSRLPFFRKNPELHIEIPGLSYEKRILASFQIYLLIYNIRRGPQPYSARRLCEFLLRRQVSLEENGRPVSAMGNEPFTEWEFAFLEQATVRALMNKQSSEMYWRARYLHELAIQTSGSEEYDQRLNHAKSVLEKVWNKISCDQKYCDLINSNFAAVDFLSALVILEDLLLNHTGEKAERELLYTRLFQYLYYYRTKIQTKAEFTTGSMIQGSDIQDCLTRISRLRQEEDRFVIRHLMSLYQFK